MATRQLSTKRIVNLTSDPVSGTTGELYYNTAIGEYRFYNGVTWTSLVEAITGATTEQILSDTAPLSPNAGDIWFDTTTGKTYFYYDTIWVEVGTSEGGRPLVLSGDVTGTGTDNIATTLGPSGVAAGVYGASTAIPVITVDVKGRVTNASTAALNIDMFRTITDGTNTATPTSPTDTFTISTGSGISAVINPTTDTATFTNTGVLSVNGGTGVITNIGVTTNPLSQFASTSSAQLAGVLSDETGFTTGALAVFSISPTITTPIIDSIVASAAGATTTIHSAVTTGSISIGAGLTTGTLNLAAAGTGATNINIGHTNAVVGITGAVTVNNNLTVTGTLTVNGTTTTVNSTTVTVDDPIITLGGDTAPVADDNKDRGIEFRYYDTQARLGFMGYDDSAGTFVFLTAATNTSEVFSGTKGTIDANISGSNINAGTVSATYIDSAIARLASPTFTGTVTLPLTTAGYVTTTSGGVIGSVATIPNAGLTNSSVTVNGVAISLGGSGTVTAAAGTLTGTTLNATVTGSSLTSVGTVSSGIWNAGAVTSSGIITANAGGQTLTLGPSTADHTYIGFNARTATPSTRTGYFGFPAAASTVFTWANEVNGGNIAINTNAGSISMNSALSVTGTVTATTFSGSGASLTNIPNGALTNSSVTVNGTAISLGGSGTVTAAAGTLTGTTLNSTVVTSSLTSVGTITSGTWNAGAVTSSGVVQGTRLVSTIATGTAPLTVASTTVVTNLNADLLDGIDSSRMVYGINGTGTNTASATQDLTAIQHYKSGFWEVSAGAYMPNTSAWYWGITMAHASNGPTYLYGSQIVVENSNAGGFYLRTLQGGATPNAGAWTKIWNEANDGAASGLDADLLDGLQGSAYSPVAGSSSIVTVGTITSGTWNAGAVTSSGVVQGTNLALSTGNIYRTADTDVLNIWGGTSGLGANVELYGSTHATLPSRAFYDASLHTFRSAASATWVTIDATGIAPTVTADTATTASHYFVETATDGYIRPKTLANVRTEIVTTAAVNAAAATTVGTITSGVWNAGAVTSSGAVQGTTLTSTVAIGTSPLTVTSTTMVTNLNSEYLAGYRYDPIVQGLRANRSLNGGGTITVDVSGNVLWDTRFIVISNGRGATTATAGYWDITCPTTGTITGVGGQANVTATAAGIPLNAWTALYYILPMAGGQTSNAANFRVASYTSDLVIPSDWVLIAIRNGDNGLFYFNNGLVLPLGTSSAGTSVPMTVRTTGTAFTLGASAGKNENGGLLEVSAAVTITVPADATTNFPIGTQITVLQTTTNQVTLAPAATVTLNGTPGLKLRAQWSSATLIKRASNLWVAIGDLAA